MATYEIEVIRGSHEFGSSADTSTVDISSSGLPDLSSCAYFLGGEHRLSMGPATGTSTNQTDMDLLFSSYLVDPSTISVNRSPTGTNVDYEAAWEVWAYNGAPDGDNKFILHSDDVEITNGNLSSTVSFTSVTDFDKCVPYAIAVTNDNTSKNGTVQRLKVRFAKSGSNTVEVYRQQSFQNTTVKVGLIEFIGSNWTVQTYEHSMSSAGSVEEPSLVSAVSSWNNTFIIHSFVPPPTENGLSETSMLCHPGSDTSHLGFFLYSGAQNPSTGYTSNAYIIENPTIQVQHSYSTSGSALNSGDLTVNVTLSSVDMLRTGTNGNIVCNGIGNAYPRQIGHQKLTSSTNLNVERKRPDQSWHYSSQAIQFSDTAAYSPSTFKPAIQVIMFM